jgi:hypothetical protein
MGPFGMPMTPGDGSSGGGGGETTFGGKAITQNGNPWVFDGPDADSAVDQMTGLIWIDNGNKFIASIQTSGSNNSYGLYEFDTTTPYSTLPTDISYNNVNFLTYNAGISGADFSPLSITFNGDGTVGYFGEDNEIFGFSMSTPYDISTATGTGFTKTSIPNAGPPYGYGAMKDLRFNSDGTKMFVVEVSGNDCAIQEFSLSTAYDVTTRSASATATFDPTTASNGGGVLNAIEFSADGKKMYALGPGGLGGVRFLYEYDLSTGFDISTISYNDERVDLEALAGIDLAQSLTFNNDFSKLYIACGNDGMFQFNWGTPSGSGVSREFTGETGNNITYSNASTGGTGDFTFEIFVDVDTVASNQTFATMGDTSVRYNSSSSEVELANTSGTKSFSNSALLADGTFDHIAVVRNGTEAKLYLNGSNVDSGTMDKSITGDVVIGSKADGNEPVNGRMYALRVAREQIYTSTFAPPTTALVETTNTDLVTLQTAELPPAKNGATPTVTGTVPTSTSSPVVSGGNVQAQESTFTGSIGENGPGAGGPSGSAYAMASSGLDSDFADEERLRTNGTYTIVGSSNINVYHTGPGTTGSNQEILNAGWAWIIRNSDGAVMKSWNGMLNGDYGDSNLSTETDGGRSVTSKFITCCWGMAVGINDKYCFTGAPYRPVGGSVSTNNYSNKNAYIFAYKLSDFSLAKVWKVNDFASQLLPRTSGSLHSAFGSGLFQTGMEVTNDGLYIGATHVKSTFGDVQGGAFIYFDISDDDPANWSSSPDAVVKNPINVVSNPTTLINGSNYSNGDFGGGIRVDEFSTPKVVVINHTAWVHRYTQNGNTFTKGIDFNPVPPIWDGGYVDISPTGNTWYVADGTNDVVKAYDLNNNFSVNWSYSYTTTGNPGYSVRSYIHDGKEYILSGDGFDDTDGTDAGKLAVINTDGTEYKVVDNPTPNNQQFGFRFDIKNGNLVARVKPGGTSYGLQFMNGTSIFNALSPVASQATLQSGYPISWNDVIGGTTQFTQSNFHQWNNDGTKLYLGGGTNTDTIFQYTVDPAYDLVNGTITADGSKNGFPGGFYGFVWNGDGTRITINQGGAVQYNASSAWDITSVNNSSNYAVLQTYQGSGSYEYGFFGDNGNKYYGGMSGWPYKLQQWNLQTPYDLSNASVNWSGNELEWGPQSVQAHGGAIKSDGKKVYLALNLNSDVDEGIWEYTLLTAWDLSSALFTGVYKSTSADLLGYPRWLSLVNDQDFYFHSNYEVSPGGQWVGKYSLPAQQNQGGGGASGPQGWITTITDEVGGYGYPDAQFQSLDVDSNDNIYIGGDGGTNWQVVVKMLSDGTVDNAAYFGGSGATNNHRAIAVASDGSIFVAGEAKDVWNRTDGHTMRLTTSLSKSYDTFFGEGYNDEHFDITTDGNGNAFAVGEAQSYSGAFSSDPKGYLVKYDSSGGVARTQISTSFQRSYPQGVSSDGTNVYVIAKDQNHMFIAKVNNALSSVTWSKNWGSNSAEPRIMDIDTNSSGESVALMYESNKWRLALIDSSGNATWRITWEKASTDHGAAYPGYDFSAGYAVKLLANGSIAVLAGHMPWTTQSYKKSLYIIIFDSTGSATVQKEFRLTNSSHYLGNIKKSLAELSDGKIVMAASYYRGSNSASSAWASSVFKFDPTDTSTAINGVHGDWEISDITDSTVGTDSTTYTSGSSASLSTNMSMYFKTNYQGNTNGFGAGSLTMDSETKTTLNYTSGSATPSGVLFNTTGTHTWTVPDNVTTISVVAVGGGGGGYGYWNVDATELRIGTGGSGGTLSYSNNIYVTPGETLDVTVGAGGIKGNQFGGAYGGVSYSAQPGVSSKIERSGSILIQAKGGDAIGNSNSDTNVGLASYSGGSGGGHGSSVTGGGGGGGAGGYSGTGGSGGSDQYNPWSPTAPGGSGSGGGGSGGRGAGGQTSTGQGGGGVGLYGEGSSGTGGQGAGGSGGTNGSSSAGGTFGGGGGAGYTSVPGAQGGIRIIWGDVNTARTFPSTNTDQASSTDAETTV